MLAAFAGAAFGGALLLFLVQPMIAKALLPGFGGTPAVWTTAMLFFQGILVAGYGYAHVIGRLPRRVESVVHLVVLMAPVAILPTTLQGRLPTASGTDPALLVLVVLALLIGAPYFSLSTTGPLMGRWFSTLKHHRSADPYFLYAVSNVGSLLGLLAYPFLIEPRIPLAGQSLGWSIGYVVYAVFMAACTLTYRRTHRTAPTTVGPREDGVARDAWVEWLLLAFVPSSLLLGVTTYLTIDIAPVPLLWVIPLLLYLATFIVAFSGRASVPTRWATRVLPVGILVVLALTLRLWDPGVVPSIVTHLGVFFVAALACHGRLASKRPPVAGLTQYYLAISIGGVLGGIFNALLAPLLFDVILEYPAMLLPAAALAMPASALTPGLLGRLLGRWWRASDLVAPLLLYLSTLAALVAASAAGGAAVGAIVAGALMATLLCRGRPLRFALSVGLILAITLYAGSSSLFTDRTFFGVHRVVADETRHVLMNGTTIHGAQAWSAGRGEEPLSYYHSSGPAGEAFRAFERVGTRRSVAVIGLGAGALLSYARPGDMFTVFEIDPAVVRIASDPQLFTFLTDSKGTVRVVVADGRVGMAAQPPLSYDLIVVDAFSSDAPPLHLMTREALALYRDRLRPGGVMLMHVSNRYLALERAIARTAGDLGLLTLERWDDRLDQAPPGAKEPSRWLVIGRNELEMAPLATDPLWMPMRPDPSAPIWTDDFSDLLSVVR